MKKEENPHRYDDIIHLPHHQSENRPHMPIEKRAAQFSPFAALTGHDNAIREMGRQVDALIEPGEDTVTHINETIQKLIKRKDRPQISVTYFEYDEWKIGGTYFTIKGNLKRIDEGEREIIFTDGRTIPIEYVFGIETETETE